MTVAKQLVLDLPVRVARGRDDFFVAPCNALAVQVLDGWRDWPQAKLVLSGPKGSGKSHLAHVWADLAGATIVEAAELTGLPDISGPIVVENADIIAGNPVAQEALFHLHNAANIGGYALMLTGAGAPSRWGIDLPDLRSRLMAIQIVTLEMPDDTLLAMMLIKLFNDRQLRVDPNLVSYLVKNMNRTHADAIALVERLDHAALTRKRPITVRFAAKTLKDSGP